MSAEGRIYREVVAKVGEDEFKLRVSREGPLLDMIYGDLVQHWDKWVAAAGAIECTNGKHPQVASAVALTMLSFAASSFIENGYDVSRDAFAKLARDMYDVISEDVALQKRAKN